MTATAPVAPSRRSRAAAIAVSLRDRVLSGRWKPGAQIEADHVLARQFGVCRATMIKSLKHLEGEGLLRSHHGKGRFVVDPARPRRTGVIGCVVSLDFDPTRPIISSVYRGMRSTDYHLKILAVNTSAQAGDSAADRDMLWPLRNEEYDGLIIGNWRFPVSAAMELAARTPIVWREHESLPPNICGVGPDFAGGAHAAAAHLVELGHRRVGLVCVSDVRYSGRAAYEGARLAMLGVAGGALLAERTEANVPEQGHAAARRLLERPDRPTAVFCGSDELALGVIRAARELGLCIPKDLSLIGWNDTLTADQAPAPMTTIRVDHEHVGEVSVQKLIWMLNHPGQATATENVPVELVVRASTAAPAKRGA